MFLQNNALTFGYDQARDALIAKQIISGDIKIQGPPSSAPGLYHGVFYYYLLAPAYLIGHGSPIVVAYYLAFLNSLTVFIVFLQRSWPRRIRGLHFCQHLYTLFHLNQLNTQHGLAIQQSRSGQSL